MLKEYGLQFGRSIGSQFRRKVREMIGDGHLLAPVIEMLLTIHEQVSREQEKLDRQVRSLAHEDETKRRLMTVPGVGVVTALTSAIQSMIPRAFAPPPMSAPISSDAATKATRRNRHQRPRLALGDRLLRTYLYEAASVLMHRIKKWSTLKALGHASVEADRYEEGQSGSRPEDRGPSSLHLGRRHQFRVGHRKDGISA
ncbi:hypothetical protein [Mesorhizobium sp.]|uniref:hypothetical protein n=1 Tax=Mesorhizobium sp. TaxID=1871066 RepID=UPI00258F3591|nr:hypothetical protein [Mesorhizobium sp.]